MLKRIWIQLIIIGNMSFMLTGISVSSESVNIDILNQEDGPVDHSVVTIDTKKSVPRESKTRYGIGYELRMEKNKPRSDLGQIKNTQHIERPSRPERPERFFRPERPQRPERPNRPGR